MPRFESATKGCRDARVRLQTAASPVAILKLVLDLVTPPKAKACRDDVTESRPVRLAMTDRA